MSASPRPQGGHLRRRQFLTGVGAAALALPTVRIPAVAGTTRAGGAQAAQTAGTSPFPPVPTADTTTTEDRQQMLWQLGLTQPTLPPMADDPDRPPNTRPIDPSNPEGVYTDSLGHYVTRSSFGQWNTYDDDTGAAGGAESPFGAYGPLSEPRYPDIPLLVTSDGTPVRTATDWWTRRRPEILRQVQDSLYGRIPPREHWRHRIEHGGAMYPPLAARAAALGIVVASQPGFLSALGDGFAEAFPDQSDQLYSFASWRRAGITVAGSSDAPVIAADPLLGIRDAMLRRTGGGRVLGPAEHLSARDALALYTTQAAFASHRENEIGSLEPGKLADFVVLDSNPLETEPEKITDIRVLATVLGGAPVHQPGASFPVS